MQKILMYLIIAMVELNFMVITGFCQGVGSSISTGLEFEQLADARAGGMGQAISAMEGDVNLVHYNPAGIASLKKPEIGFTYMVTSVGNSDDMYFANLSYGQPVFCGVIGTSISYYNAGTIELLGQNVNAQTDLVLTFFYATQIKDLLLGGSFKTLLSTWTQQYNGQAYAFDVGCLYHTPIKGLNLGLALQNKGSQLIYSKTHETLSPETLPVYVRMGTSYRIDLSKDAILYTNFEIKYLMNEMNFTSGVGTEFIYGNIIAVRAGYIFGISQGFTLGAGFNLQNYTIDYAFKPIQFNTPFGSHRIGLKMRL